MKSFEEFMMEANRPGNPLVQRPVFGGLSSESLSAFIQQFKDTRIGDLINTAIRYSRASREQPETQRLLAELAAHLKATNDIFARLEQANAAEQPSTNHPSLRSPSGA